LEGWSGEAIRAVAGIWDKVSTPSSEGAIVSCFVEGVGGREDMLCEITGDEEGDTCLGGTVC